MTTSPPFSSLTVTSNFFYMDLRHTLCKKFPFSTNKYGVDATFFIDKMDVMPTMALRLAYLTVKVSETIKIFKITLHDHVKGYMMPINDAIESFYMYVWDFFSCRSIIPNFK